MHRINTGIFRLLASHSVIAAGIMCLLALPVAAQDAIAPITAVAPPKALPAFDYSQPEGKRPFDAGRHRLTILHFWATWCVPCVAELPEVDAVSGAYGSKGVQVIALSLDGDAGPVKTFYADKRISHLPVALDAMNTAFSAVGVRGLPATLFVNAKGQVIARADGPLDWKAKETKDFIEKQLP